jgi:Flp pilus assembly pilin Flp
MMLFALWDDEDGVILSAELVLIGTILILGMIVGLVGLQTAVVAELSDLGNSFGNSISPIRRPA